jgi:guanosine-3',5'-bis(diphosphate) 3'-pyrophosphohydrolase
LYLLFLGMDNDILNEITRFADEAHGEQLRRYGNDRYIVHPLRVMEICRIYNPSLSVLAAAILHDVVEDTPVTAATLHEFLLSVIDVTQAEKVTDLVVDLTDVYIKKEYPHINRARRKEMERDRLSKVSAEAQTIKYADILDNARDIFVNDRHFAPRFLNEGVLALRVMTKGDQRLREHALGEIENFISSFNE